MRKGIDISTWQKDVDYKKLKEQGIEFAIIRCGYGKDKNQKDAMFETHYKGLKEVGIKVGAYHYSYCTSLENAELEAKNCLEIIKGKQFELPVFYDLEERITRVLGKETITKIALKFCEVIELNGYRAGVYANLDWFKNYIDVKQIEKYYIWLAQWGEKHTADFKVDFWQYTSTGKILGINGFVDLNYDLNNYVNSNNNIQSTHKTDDEIVEEVIKGYWGNGEERKQNLIKAGYNYNSIQEKVNKIMKPEILHIVKYGETLTSIAKKYNTTIFKIVQDNNIKDANKIYVNQKLIIK